MAAGYSLNLCSQRLINAEWLGQAVLIYANRKDENDGFMILVQDSG